MTGIMAAISGGASDQVYLPANINRTSTHVAPTDSFAGVRFNSSGALEVTAIDATTLSYTESIGPWLLSGSASGYDVKMNFGSPDAFSGSGENVWLNLGTTREFYAAMTGNGIRDSSAVVEIRDAASLVVLKTSSVSMYAESTS